MKKKIHTKKIVLSSMSVVLAFTVLLTALPNISLTVDALTPTNPTDTTQTGYGSLIDFQKDKWNNILDDTFKNNGVVKHINPDQAGATAGDESQIPIPDKNGVSNLEINESSKYFNWEKTTLDKWDGEYHPELADSLQMRTETITYESDTVEAGDGNGTNNSGKYTADEQTVEYIVYDVRNANELATAMSVSKNTNVKINLINDIDLGGDDDTKRIWDSSKCSYPTDNSGKIFYFEGNGYTIYNMRTQGTSAPNGIGYNGPSFFGVFDKSANRNKIGRNIIKNLNFSNCLSISKSSGTSIVVSCNFYNSRMYMENVNVKDSFVYSNRPQTGTLLGRNEATTADIFIRNCSSQNCIVFGTDHSGGLTGCQHNTGTKYRVKYDAPFPKSPEAWMFNDIVTYPEIVENCYSVDCTLFSLGVDGDSGGLLSCGGKLICRNSFTNNTVYGRTKTGAFFGRVVTPESGRWGLYDDGGERQVEIYFENCYASGSIEGIEKIGGFVGFTDGVTTVGFGVPVYKNCYTTAMTGMDYAGSNLGGFIGHENTSTVLLAVIKDENGNQINKYTGTGNKKANPGSVYINCYAAGEVGNILTDTSVTASGNQLGGFLGLTGYYGQGGTGGYHSSSLNGTYINCYYDMQATAMRERACGKSNQFTSLKDSSGNPVGVSQIPGVTGVYTQHSEKKEVPGLADTVNMGDSNAWKNNTANDQYPMLKAFDDYAEENFKKACYGLYADETTRARIDEQLAEKTEIVKKYSQASVSTVLLNHWDSTMNMDTGSLDNETQDFTPGLPVNKFEKTAYADDDEKWSSDDDGYFWQKEYKNLTAGQYQLKVQEGASWVYNFGKEKFNGANCELIVSQDCDVKIKFDYTGSVSELGENTNYKIWAEFYNKNDGSKIGQQELGKHETTQNVWTVVGGFGNIASEANWDPGYKKFDMYLVGDSQYVLTADIIAGKYEFKIAKDHSWAHSYGLDGEDGGENNNMSFTVSKDCKVRFVFDEETHLTTVSTDPEDALTEIKTKSEPIDFNGFSLIAPKAITGHEWLDSKEAAEVGKMEDADGDGVYEKTFTVNKTDDDGKYNFNKTYGYKVIENAIDAGPNNFFHINEPADNSIEEINLKFTYDSTTREAKVECITDQSLIDPDPQVSSYGVLGTESLTGNNWGKDVSGTKVPDAGLMTADGNGIYSITFNDVLAGDHSFKVVANCDFDSGIDYGAYDGSGNYDFTTSKQSNVTIKFNSNDKRITVHTSPADALIIERYVVSGTATLTGENWNIQSTANEMTFDERTGTFVKTYDNLPGNTDTNYVFKVVKYGEDNKSENNVISIGGENGKKYKLEIVYYPKIKGTEYHLYDSNGKDVSEYIKEPKIDFYSVVGDEGLTGYNWLGENNSDQAAAAEKGKMTADSNGNLSVTFKDVPVSSTMKSVGFKVVANGTWDSGISYGNSNGGNYSITLASDKVSECSVTVIFNPQTYKITVITNPAECNAQIDESKFNWYIAGDKRLVSDDRFIAHTTVYDTVRDITTDFKFTSGESISWDNNNAKNSESNFFNKVSFGIDYNVESNDIHGDFEGQIIKLETNSINDANGKTITEYSCKHFMPGKQWLTVSSVKNMATGSTVTGTRSLRLIPTAFLEAGNEADIKVLQAKSDVNQENIHNVVTYRKNSLNDNGSGIRFSGLEDADGNKTIFDSYNFALTAGYAITDRNGLGYYGNYSKQNKVEYDDSKLRPNVLDPKYANDYFLMTSAFTQSGNYTDAALSTNKGLIVDELVDQSLIGSSYKNENTYAKTIVKIYKKVEDENGTLEADGKKYSYPKVFMDSSDDSTTEYHTNYLKWTGQKPFNINDEGTYYVTYYWSLSDGRFLTDSKKVYISPDFGEIEKTVNKHYIEKDGTEADKTIQYSVTYKNGIEGDFKIFDALPFKDDIRYDSTNEDGFSKSTMGDDTKFKLKSVDVTAKTVSSKNLSKQVAVNNLSAYYTTDQNIGNNIKDAQSYPDATAANKVDLTDGKWTRTSNNSSPNVDDVTAIAVTGVQINAGISEITITYTVEVTDPSIQECYVNNAFFSATDKESQKGIYGYSGPATSVTVSRGLSGYAWFDNNVNGIFDKNEPPIQNVKVILMRKSNEDIINSVTTDEDGFYEFSGIALSGDDYKLQFSAPDVGTATIKYSKVASSTNTDTPITDFNSLNLSRVLSKAKVNDKNKSRNIAHEGSDATNKIYEIDENLPTAEIISAYNNMDYDYGTVKGYYFSRRFQNLGLTNVDVKNKKCTLRIHKVDSDSNQPLENVVFKLEYRGDEQEDYEVVSFIKNGDVFEFTSDGTAEGVIAPEDVKTDSNGDIVFTNLPIAEYKLTEVETAEGYNLLASSLEFSLPYSIENGDNDAYIHGNDENSEDNIYYDITYTIKNSKIPQLPLTGVSDNNLPMIIFAFALFVVWGMFFGTYKIRNKKFR